MVGVWVVAIAVGFALSEEIESFSHCTVDGGLVVTHVAAGLGAGLAGFELQRVQGGRWAMELEVWTRVRKGEGDGDQGEDCEGLAAVRSYIACEVDKVPERASWLELVFEAGAERARR